ncbi:MAG: ABC transporter substrate-binding protein [Hyphomicrobiaceae bacterium]
MSGYDLLNRRISRRVLLGSAATAAATIAAPAVLRAQTREIVIGCAASHTGWMTDIVAPVFEAKHNAKIIVEGTRSLVNLEKMRSNKANPYLSVVQMDDPVMIMAVEEGLLEPITPATVPNLAKLRPGATHMDGMWANYVQPWAGIGYNSTSLPAGVETWTALWDASAKGKIIIPSLQNTEGMWTLFAAAQLATGKPLEAAQYEIDAAFDKLKELKPNLLSVYTVMTQAFNLLEQGEISMLAGNWSAYALPRKAQGSPVDLAAPKEGIFAMPSGICLVKGGPNQDLALAYINEMLGAELQTKLAESTFAVPANTEVSAGPKIPAGVPLFGPDWAFVSKNRAAWIERFDRLMAS